MSAFRPALVIAPPGLGIDHEAEGALQRRDADADEVNGGGMMTKEIPARTSESETLERRLEQIRARIATLAKELESRGHRPSRRRFQLKDHAPDLAVAAAGALLVAGATTATRSWHQRRSRRALVRARQVRDAMSRFFRNPELIARPEPTIGKTVMTALVGAAAATAARTLSRKLVFAAPKKT
jgi:hypothetical protein